MTISGREFARPKAVAVGQLGSRMHYAVPRILASADWLAEFHTDVYFGPRLIKTVAWLARNTGTGGGRRIASRHCADLPAALVRAHVMFGLAYASRQRRARGARELAQVHRWAGDKLGRLMIAGGLRGAGSVFIVGSAARGIFEHARHRGLSRITEQIIAPAALELQILSEELARFPDWEQGESSLEFSRAFQGVSEEEWALSNLIVCGSEFVREGIRQVGGPADKCVVVPYGVQLPVRQPRPPFDGRRKLRVLTVGAVGLRKGAPYVLEAARALADCCEFRMVGSIDVAEKAREALRAHLQLTGPVPKGEVPSHYTWADLFLLPSLFEGSATVTYEAMAYGLPVIATPNTGSVVREGHDGYVVPIRQAGPIVAHLRRLAGSPGELARLAGQALETSREFDLSRYGDRLLQAMADRLP